MARRRTMHSRKYIRRRPVDSTAVRSVGYDIADWVLQVEFEGGGIYNYFRVPPEEHAKLMAAPSIGRYVSLEIKPYYEYEEVATA
jgi:hypothetical protein